MRPDIGKGEPVSLPIEEFEEIDLTSEDLPKKNWEIDYYINFISPEFHTRTISVSCVTVPSEDQIKKELLGSSYNEYNHMIKITKVKEFIKL